MKTEKEIKKELNQCIEEETRIEVYKEGISTFRGKTDGWIQALKWVLKNKPKKKRS